MELICASTLTVASGPYGAGAAMLLVGITAMASLFTIGHSNHSPARFLELLAQAEIETVADIRSQPVSRWAPQYNKDALISTLEACGISYLFMGRELGGRPRDVSLTTRGKPDYAKMAKMPAFREAIGKLKKEAGRQRIALLCAERDPVDCHRFLLIARHLSGKGVDVAHILPSGEIESHDAAERRLKSLQGQEDLFA